MKRAQADGSLRWLTRRDRRFNAVIGGVADQVRQRVTELFQHALVDLGVLARHFQPDLFSGGLRDVVHGSCIALEERADGKHAHGHHALVQLAGIALHGGH